MKHFKLLEIIIISTGIIAAIMNFVAKDWLVGLLIILLVMFLKLAYWERDIIYQQAEEIKALERVVGKFFFSGEDKTLRGDKNGKTNL